ncbi:MAG: uroporphyrinogen decarboxylase family protein [Anaerolineae bacterium]|nr:uroporphyrinogen decarboxylase family protein [Anaerolineae bacterium]
MTTQTLTSLDRIQITLNHQEADRVPFLLPAIMQGARELGLTIHDYFLKAENVIEGQYRIRQKLGHDAVIGFFYAALEMEAWGGETIFTEYGPPNSGTIIINKPEDILNLQSPKIKESARLHEVIKTIQGLKERVGHEAPVIGCVVSPFSLPVMQMGFDRYFDLLYERPDLFERLMQLNEEFCVEWANTQLEAGASVISYFDPVSSPTIIPKELYLKTGFKVAKRTISRIKGNVMTGFASGRCLPIIDEVVQTGSIAVGSGFLEDLHTVKMACKNRLVLMGDLNPIDMRCWDEKEVESRIKKSIAGAGPGGGFILTDMHGEIPWQVSDETLLQISDAVRRWGQYPLRWIGEEENGRIMPSAM